MIINMQSGGVVPERIIDAQTIIPGIADQVMAAGTYLRGAQTIKGDADLIPGNIKDGVNLFGVLGTCVEEKPLPGPFTKMARDTIVFTNRTAERSCVINHTLGVKPIFMLMIASEVSHEAQDLYAIAGLLQGVGTGDYDNLRAVYSYWSNTLNSVIVASEIEMTVSDSQINSLGNKSCYFAAGIEYTVLTMA